MSTVLEVGERVSICQKQCPICEKGLMDFDRFYQIGETCFLEGFCKNSVCRYEEIIRVSINTY